MCASSCIRTHHFVRRPWCEKRTRRPCSGAKPLRPMKQPAGTIASASPWNGSRDRVGDRMIARIVRVRRLLRGDSDRPQPSQSTLGSATVADADALLERDVVGGVAASESRWVSATRTCYPREGARCRAQRCDLRGDETRSLAESRRRQLPRLPAPRAPNDEDLTVLRAAKLGLKFVLEPGATRGIRLGPPARDTPRARRSLPATVAGGRRLEGRCIPGWSRP